MILLVVLFCLYRHWCRADPHKHVEEEVCLGMGRGMGIEVKFRNGFQIGSEKWILDWVWEWDWEWISGLDLGMGLVNGSLFLRV